MFFQFARVVAAVMFVAIGWLSFFIDRAVAPARVGMVMVCFLANMNFLAAQLSTLPRLGHAVWLLRLLSVSVYFSFYSVLEYVFCNWLRRIKVRITGARKRAEEESVCKTKGGGDVEDAPEAKKELPEGSPVTKQDIKAIGFMHKADLFFMKDDTKMYVDDDQLEIFSRWAYPIAYTVTFLALWYTI